MDTNSDQKVLRSDLLKVMNISVARDGAIGGGAG